jgi:hypothetical protein
MKPVHFVFTVATLLAGSGIAAAQALPTASRAPIQVGIAGSFVSTDYAFDYSKGITVYGDLGFTKRFSLEADVHQTSLSTPSGVGEDSYLVGPRYSLIMEDRANVYVKALGGIGRFVYEPKAFSNPHSNSYGAFAFGAGIEYQLSRRFNVRAIDIEYQTWPGYPPRGLTPFVTTIGIAYVR